MRVKWFQQIFWLQEQWYILSRQTNCWLVIFLVRSEAMIWITFTKSNHSNLFNSSKYFPRIVYLECVLHMSWHLSVANLSTVQCSMLIQATDIELIMMISKHLLRKLAIFSVEQISQILKMYVCFIAYAIKMFKLC